MTRLSLFVLAGVTCALGVVEPAAAASAAAPAKSAAVKSPASAELYGIWELTLAGPSDGNPFVDVELWAEVSQGDRRVKVRGFYDGAGTYRVRFAPEREGQWSYVTRSNRAELSGRTGSFRVGRAAAGNHGPVRVRDRFHFAYADGKPYFPFGTTVYALAHQELPLQAETMATLAKAPFNKVRLCVFPKWYSWNRVEPPLYPFEKKAEGGFDLAHPNVEFFRLLETRVAEMAKLGIEADLILFHPYDENHWGFDRMGREADERYLRYVMARFGAFRNVWWSMANEWDFVKHRSVDDWNRLFDIIAAEDGHRHLTSIHHGGKMFDHNKTPITHVSVQSADVHRLREWRETYGKPAIDDECEYEGDIESPWGNLTAQELVHRHWVGFLHGGYVGHGETYRVPNEVLWWGRGGVLRGQSPARIGFLRKLVEQGGPLEPLAHLGWPFTHVPSARQGDSYLVYLGQHQPSFLTSFYPNRIADKDVALKAARWRFEIIDTWEMTVTPVPGEYEGKYEVKLPTKPGLAIRATPILHKAGAAPGKVTASN